MQCAEFEDRLNRLLDHRLSPEADEQLATHAHDCDGCGSLLAAQQQLFRGLRRGTPRPPADLADRVMSRRHSEVSRRATMWRNVGWGVLLASAASLGGFAMMALRARDQRPEIVENPPVVAPAKPPSGLGFNTVGPTRRTEPKADKQFGVYIVALGSLATQISDSKEFDEVSESLEPSIKPIRSSFELAIDALRRTLPLSREPRGTKSDAGAQWSLDGMIVS